MIWTILLLVLAIALFMFGGMLFKHDSKKPSACAMMAKKFVKLVAIVLVTGCVTRLFVPYYLTSVNPAILQEMANGMQAQENEDKNKLVRSYVRSNADKMMADAPILGNVDAKNTIFIWTDFSCPYCRRVHGELERVLADRDDVRVVLKNFSIHGPLSDAPAKAVIAAKIQGNDKAAALASKLMTNEFYSQEDMADQSKIGEKVEANVMNFAAEVGLDTAKLAEDMNGEVVSRELANVRELAQLFKINGTPFLIIGESAFPGAIPYDQIINALN
ncbi:MAG: thioredoxin domain-containing protein [Alphaproteobacteria bacterium]|nr:thioredoxin domain-containing protein [Alphaproteobacteria bacterium]